MSDKETEKFIDAFEERDCLWRTTSLEYCDRNVPHIHKTSTTAKPRPHPTRSHLSPLFTFLCYCSNDNSRQTQLEFVVCIHVLTDVTSRVIKTYDVYDVYAIGVITWCIMNIYEVAFDMLKQQATCSIRHSRRRMLQVACCFDMLPVAVRHVEATCRTLLPHVAGVDGA